MKLSLLDDDEIKAIKADLQQATSLCAEASTSLKDNNEKETLTLTCDMIANGLMICTDFSNAYHDNKTRASVIMDEMSLLNYNLDIRNINYKIGDNDIITQADTAIEKLLYKFMDQFEKDNPQPQSHVKSGMLLWDKTITGVACTIAFSFLQSAGISNASPENKGHVWQSIVQCTDDGFDVANCNASWISAVKKLPSLLRDFKYETFYECHEAGHFSCKTLTFNGEKRVYPEIVGWRAFENTTRDITIDTEPVVSGSRGSVGTTFNGQKVKLSF